MIRNKTGNNSFLKQLNQAAILDLIRVHRAVSKAELAKLTGLSPTAAGVITSSLLEKGYIHETGTGESRGGRKPILLELNPRSFYSVGIDLDLEYISILLIDITGEVIHEKAIKMLEYGDFKKVTGVLENTVSKVLKQFGVETDRLLGIGISVPGLIDSITKELILAPNLGWSNVDIKSGFTKFNGVPVTVENEAMASAICENWVGACQGIDNFVCINVGAGIGAGIFTHGKPYRGCGGSAGEVGHVVVDENGPKCGCGNYGCLETLASTTRIVEQAKRLVRQGTASKLNEVEDADSMHMEHVLTAAGNGDEEARRILAESARYIGIAISNMVNTLNPSKVVIGKEFVRFAELVLDYIKEVVACKALKYPASKVEIVSSDIGEKASALGAAIIPLKVLFGR